MKLFVGNLPPAFRERDLQELFSSYGTIISAKIIMDRETNRSKGFGFVELDSKEAGMKAISELDKKVVGNGPIVVNEARPQVNRGGDFNSPKKRFSRP